jgi:cell division septum initiation protein DivIVA
MKEFEYEYFTQEDKVAYLEAELKRFEGQHFSMSLMEPNRLQSVGDEYIQWQKQVEQAEQFISKLRKQLAQVKDNG